jgi:hypothetical protein
VAFPEVQEELLVPSDEMVAAPPPQPAKAKQAQTLKTARCFFIFPTPLVKKNFPFK